jgi:hypothetical protein
MMSFSKFLCAKPIVDRERMSLIKAICAKPFKSENLEGKKGREITNAQTTTYIPDNLKNLLLEIQEGWIQTDTTADCGVEERGGTQGTFFQSLYWSPNIQS